MTQILNNKSNYLPHWNYDFTTALVWFTNSVQVCRRRSTGASWHIPRIPRDFFFFKWEYWQHNITKTSSAPEMTAWRPPHPKMQANPIWCHTTLLLPWIHISSFTTCLAFTVPALPPTETHSNPIQSKRGVKPRQPLPPVHPAGRLSRVVPPLYPPYPLQLLHHPPSPKEKPPWLPVPRQCNPIPAGPEPEAWHGPDPIRGLLPAN